MAQYFYDLGANAPTLTVGSAGIQPVTIGGLKFVQYGSGVDLSQIRFSRTWDDRLGKWCLLLNPIDDASMSGMPIALMSPVAFGDFEALVRYRASRGQGWGTISYFNFGGGIVGRCVYGDIADQPSEDFSKGLHVSAGGGLRNSNSNVARTMRLYSAGYGSQKSATTSTTYLSADSHSAENRTRFMFCLRVLVVGKNIKARAWRDDVAEPSTWEIDVSRPDLPDEGHVGFYMSGGIEGRVCDSLAIATEGDPLPSGMPGGNRSIVGTLRKPDNSIAQGYVVRCYHRDSGALLGETLSDAAGQFSFSLPLPSSEKVYCLAIDQKGNSWAAPIKDMITPV